MMICPTCRQPNPDETPTCSGCGLALPSTVASPPVTSAVLDNHGMTGGQWMRTRFVPVVLAAAIVGALLGMARGAMNTVFFGIQGMLVGGVGGYLATRFGRSDPERFWSIGQRFWLGVGVMLTFTTADLVATSAAHAGPIDTPLYWLTEVVDGFVREPFLSVTHTGSASGAMTGTWWIIFTVVDAALLLFLFVGGSAAGLGGAKRPAAPEALARTASARNAAVAVAVLIAAGGALYAYAPWRQQENPYSLENAKRIRQLAGQWKMGGGHGVFAETDEELRFSLKAVGYNALVGLPAGGGRYRMSIDNHGDDYRGMLFTARNGETAMPLYFRMRPSPDASRLTMVFTVYGMGGRREVVITATRPRP
jgi:hypothetical protein